MNQSNRLIDAAYIQTICQPVIGLKLSRVWLRENRYLALKFPLDPPPSEPAPFPYYLLEIWWCAWRIETNADGLAGWDDTPEHIHQALTFLEQQRLVHIDIQSSSLKTDFYFENNAVIKTLPYHTQGTYPYWDLITPDSMILKVGPPDALSLSHIVRKKVTRSKRKPQ